MNQRYLIVLLTTIILLIAFSLLVFKGNSETFSLQEKAYLRQIEEIKNQYQNELPKLEQQIEKTLQKKRTSKVLEVIFKKKKLTYTSLKIGEKKFRNVIALNKSGKVIYVQNRKNYKKPHAKTYSQIPKNILFISPNNHLAIKKSYQKKQIDGFLIFEFDIAEILKQLYKKNVPIEGEFLYYQNSFILDKGSSPSLVKEIKDKIKSCNQIKKEWCKFYLIQSKKRLLLHILSILDNPSNGNKQKSIRVGFLYPSNVSDIPAASIFVFILLFVILVVFFIIIFIHHNFKREVVESPIDFIKHWSIYFFQKKNFSLKNFSNFLFFKFKKPTKIKVNHDITHLFKEINMAPNYSHLSSSDTSFAITPTSPIANDDKEPSSTNNINKTSNEKTAKKSSPPKAKNSKHGINKKKSNESPRDNNNIIEIEKLEENNETIQTTQSSIESVPEKALEKSISKSTAKNNKNLASLILQQKSRFFSEEKSKIEILKEILALYKIKFAIIFEKKIDHFQGIEALNIDLSTANNFLIYQDQKIYQDYFKQHQGVLIKNQNQQSKFLKSYLPSSVFEQLEEFFFLPISHPEHAEEIELLVAFN